MKNRKFQIHPRKNIFLGMKLHFQRFQVVLGFLVVVLVTLKGPKRSFVVVVVVVVFGVVET